MKTITPTTHTRALPSYHFARRLNCPFERQCFSPRKKKSHGKNFLLPWDFLFRGRNFQIF